MDSTGFPRPRFSVSFNCCQVSATARSGFMLIAVAASLAFPVVLVSALEAEQLARIFNEARERYGTEAVVRLRQWAGLMQSARTLPEMEKLQLVNAFFNKLPNVEDVEHWGAQEYWATPLELLASNGGDCEDFALAKYFTLREIGVADERLRITYVNAYLRESHQFQSHMILTYYPAPDAVPLVLDNLVSAVKPATERTDLSPTYSFNATGLWKAKQREAGKRLGDADMLPSWPDFKSRLLTMGRAK